MKRISAIAISLMLMIGLTAEAQAVLSGTSKCNFFQGPTDDPTTFVVPVLILYNPNGAGFLSITRLRIFEHTGANILDETFPPGTNTVIARGSSSFVPVATGIAEGLQIIANWRQTVDAAAPIAKLNLLLFDNASGTYTSVSQSNCP